MVFNNSHFERLGVWNEFDVSDNSWIPDKLHPFLVTFPHTFLLVSLCFQLILGCLEFLKLKKFELFSGLDNLLCCFNFLNNYLSNLLDRGSII